jgi:hypothetical protein
MGDTYNKANILDVAILNHLDQRVTEANTITRNEFGGTPVEISSEMTPIMDRQRFTDLYEALVSISSNEISTITGSYVRLLYIYHKFYQGILDRGSVSSEEIPSISTLQKEFNEAIFALIAKSKE